MVIVDDTGYSTEAGYIINVGGMYRMLLCTPEFGIRRHIEQWFDDGRTRRRYSAGLLIVFPCVMECDGETLYVLEESTDKIYSYNATDLTPRRMSAAKMAEEALAVTTDRIFINHRDHKGIRVVDKETLELRDQIISEDAHFHDMAVLDDLLFANETWWARDDDQFPMPGYRPRLHSRGSASPQSGDGQRLGHRLDHGGAWATLCHRSSE